jgi:hypothetical protein
MILIHKKIINEWQAKRHELSFEWSYIYIYNLSIFYGFFCWGWLLDVIYDTYWEEMVLKYKIWIGANLKTPIIGLYFHSYA